MTIQSRVPREEYDALEAINITRLKYLLRSPQHYQHALTHPKQADVMTVGIATHVAVLEPERFTKEFAIWSRRSDAGNICPRKGQWWDAFQLEHKGQTILTEDQGALAQQIARAVRFDETANKYLAVGDPEASLEWEIVGGRPAKGRVDWLTTHEGQPTIVGLKTSRDCRHFQFGSQAAKLGYHLQWAWYHDGFEAITGKKPHMVEVVVESDAPHAVATYIISSDIIEQGREEYQRLLQILEHCEATDEWPGPQPNEQYLTLPTWAYPNTDDDLADLELEPIL
jgi:exodeoxyribonuclease VIII